MKHCTVTEGRANGTFVVQNLRGLHTRPASELVKCASCFQSDVRLCYHKVQVNAKSLLGVLTLEASKGAKINVEAEGQDAQMAVESILQLATKEFNIRY